MEESTVRSRFDEKKCDHGISFDAKTEQIKIATSVVNGRHCLGFLPTGFGKTLSFVISTIIEESPCITLIISPLLSLMDSQIHSLSQWGFNCARITGDTSQEEKKGIADGAYTFVFASPESVLKPAWRSIFLNDIWQARLKLLVFDEAHCLSEWGEDFRPDYLEMCQLRSFFKVPVMALTATSTAKIKEDIMAILQLDPENTDIVYRSPNRENIFISCKKKSSNDYEKELSWLTEHLKIHGIMSKKVLIFCRSIDTVSEIFITLKGSLGKSAYLDGVEDPDNLLIEMYHKCTHDTSKKRILTDFCKDSGTIRCVVATVAMGMGVDIPDIDMVVHIGCPKSVISYWQEAGRCARDGRQGFSLVMYDNFTASLKTTDKAMKAIVLNEDTKCLRSQILKTLSLGNEEQSQCKPCKGCDLPICECEACKCCSVCGEKCRCSENRSLTIESFISP